jgi:hypothetical protein
VQSRWIKAAGVPAGYDQSMDITLLATARDLTNFTQACSRGLVRRSSVDVRQHGDRRASA